MHRLSANGTSFIEVGLGVLLIGRQMGGIVRVTASTPDRNNKFIAFAANRRCDVRVLFARATAVSGVLVVLLVGSRPSARGSRCRLLE